MTDIETLRWTAREILPLKQRDWLLKALEILREDFLQIGEMIPDDIDVFVEYPIYWEISDNWLGTYWSIDKDIYINPSVNGLWALDILVHELVHAVVGGAVGHDKEFQTIAAAIGLDDTGITAGAEAVLLKRLKDIQETLGSYPLVFDCVEEV